MVLFGWGLTIIILYACTCSINKQLYLHDWMLWFPCYRLVHWFQDIYRRKTNNQWRYGKWAIRSVRNYFHQSWDHSQQFNQFLHITLLFSYSPARKFDHFISHIVAQWRLPSTAVRPRPLETVRHSLPPALIGPWEHASPTFICPLPCPRLLVDLQR